MTLARLPRRPLLAAGVALALSPWHTLAMPAPQEVQAELPGARLQGSGRLRFIGLRVYEARLWVGERMVGADWYVPLALEIEYQRSLDGAKIAERSLAEMRRQGEITASVAERWLAAMTQAFPNVREGDRLTGFLMPGQGARFFVNGRLSGELRDAEFARSFFGIWLSPQTSEPSLRQALFGQARP